MGAERVEPFKRRVSRRSVVGAGAKLAYASPLVAASFSLSPAFGYERAAAYFAEEKASQKARAATGVHPRPNPSSGSPTEARPNQRTVRRSNERCCQARCRRRRRRDRRRERGAQ